MDVGAVKAPTIQKELPMQTIKTIGFDANDSSRQRLGA